MYRDQLATWHVGAVELTGKLYFIRVLDSLVFIKLSLRSCQIGAKTIAILIAQTDSCEVALVSRLNSANIVSVAELQL